RRVLFRSRTPAPPEAETAGGGLDHLPTAAGRIRSIQRNGADNPSLRRPPAAQEKTGEATEASPYNRPGSFQPRGRSAPPGDSRPFPGQIPAGSRGSKTSFAGREKSRQGFASTDRGRSEWPQKIKKPSTGSLRKCREYTVCPGVPPARSAGGSALGQRIPASSGSEKREERAAGRAA